MRVGIDAFPALETQGGIGTYVRHLVSSLVALDSGDEFIVYVPTTHSSLQSWGSRENMSKLTCVEVSRSGLRWRGRFDDLDLYHGTNFKLHTRGRFGTVLTIHDLWLDRYPQYSKKLFGQAWASFRTGLRVRRATRVIAVSHHTARDIEELYGLPARDVSVVHPGVSQEFFRERTEAGFSALASRHTIPTRRYVLFVGGATPRKNCRALLEAFAKREDVRKQYHLVLVGNPVHRGHSILETASHLGVQDRVICTGHVSMEDLRALYSHADLFVFPSLYEGFGFPVLEAMACGTPVVTSNRTSIPEVAGDAAVLIDPEDTDMLAEAMGRILSDTVLQESLRSQGFDRIKEFSWEKTARQVLDIYREICGTR